MGTKGRVVHFCFILFLIIAVAVGSAPSLCAQSSSTGALTGTVTDSSGAVIPGTGVTLLNNATGQTQTATTSGNGSYRFSLLSPGSYSVKFSAPGFKTSEVPSVIVNVTETPVLDAKLEVGETTQQVTVTGEAVAMQTETSATGTLIESKAITSIPLTTRNYTQVLSLSAGVSTGVNNAANLGKGTQDMNVNGLATRSNNYQMDGANANNWTFNTAADSSLNQFSGIAIPNPDALGEFKIQTSQFDAGYGRNAGANVNVVTKSGTNDFHGTVFEFVRNDVFNANDFFRNFAGQPRAELKQNQFGGVIGGPIKKNKLFFFGSYQGTRQVNGLATTALSTLIQPPLTNDRSAATIGSQFCPANHPGTSAYNTFAGGVQVACDGSNINPVALTILRMKLPDGTYVLPTPQSIIASGKNAGLGLSSYSVPDYFREDQYLVNFDYVISSKHTLSERYFYSADPQVHGLDNGGGTVGLSPGWPLVGNTKNHVASLKLTSILTNNFINEASAAYTRGVIYNTTQGLPTAASLGITPANQQFPVPPAMVLSTGSLGQFDIFGVSANDFYNLADQFQWSDQISWVHGKQTIRAGVHAERQYQHVQAIGRGRGQLTFNNFTDFLIGQSVLTNGSTTGLSNVFADATMAGLGAKGGFEHWVVGYTASAFVQDDVKVNSRFTLNLGVRWEYFGSPYDTHGTLANTSFSLQSLVPIPPASGTLVGAVVNANYDPDLFNPYTGKTFGPLPAGVLVNSNNGAFINNAPLNNFAPRVGFAWQPGSKQGRLVIRGGYGIFYNQFPGHSLLTGSYTQPPFEQRIAFSGTSNGLSSLQVPVLPTTLGFIPRTPTTQFTDVVNGPLLGTEMVQQFSLNTQLQLIPSLVLELGYVRTKGNHLAMSHGLNQPLLASSSNRVNCGFDGVPADCITTNTAKNAPQRTPILGEAPTALSETDFSGNSEYDALQATLRKQFSHGLTFQFSYTYAKGLSDTTLVNDLTLRSLDKARTSFDRTHRLSVSYNYDLPTPIQNGIAGTMLKGWSLSGVTTVQTGTPLTLTDSAGGSVYGRAGTSTITLCPGVALGNLATSGRDQSRLGQSGSPSAWFNAGSSIICPPPAIGSDTPAATGYGNTGQSIIDGPGQFNWDLALGKATKVGGLREDAQLQFRVEFYNAFNHPQFNNPGTSLGSTFGVITSASVAPRLIQFGLKYLF